MTLGRRICLWGNGLCYQRLVIISLCYHIFTGSDVLSSTDKHAEAVCVICCDNTCCVCEWRSTSEVGICAKVSWLVCEALASIVSSCWCRDLSVCSSAVVLASCASIACERACQKTQVSQIHILHV